MRTTLAAAAAAAVVLLAGCPAEPDAPMPTDGPNQVVVKVPGMT